MWAQLIRTQLKPGEDVATMSKEIQAAEQPGSGLVRALTMRDQADPAAMYMLVLFGSEEQARAREQDPEREERLKPARKIMSEIFEGPPAFTDLEVLEEWTGAPAAQIQITGRFPNIPPERLAEFKALASRAMEHTRGEAGTLQYDWFLDDDESTCVVREAYVDSEAVLSHVGGLGDLFGQLVEAGGGCTFEVYGRPSPELLAATEGLEHTVLPSLFQGL